MQNDYSRAVSVLEYDVVAGLLAECAPTEGSKRLAENIYPESNLTRVRRLLLQTSDAKALMAVKGMPSFGRVRDITPSVERAD